MADYIGEHIQQSLTQALAEAAVAKPVDPVNFVGKYLLKIVSDNARQKQKQDQLGIWQKEDQILQTAVKKKAEDEASRQQKKQKEADDHESFLCSLEQCNSKAAVMQQWVQYMSDQTKSAVYIAQSCECNPENEDDEETKAVSYISASKGHEFLHSKPFIRAENRGIIFDLLQDPEAEDGEEEENDDEENEAEKKELPPKPRRKIHIDNVLIPNSYSSKLHFFKFTKVGSFLALQSNIKTFLNDEALQAPLRPGWPGETPVEEPPAVPDEKEAPAENEEEEEEEAPEENPEEEEEKEEIPEPPQTAARYIINFDTLGTSYVFNPSQIVDIDNSIQRLETALMKADVEEFLSQRKATEAFNAALAKYDTNKETVDAELEKIGTDNADAGEAKIEFLKQQHLVKAAFEVWSELKTYIIAPSNAAVVAAFVKLFDSEFVFEKTLLKNVSQIQWSDIAQRIGKITAESVESLDVSQINDWGYIKSIVSGVNEDDLSEGVGIVLNILYRFVNASALVWDSLNAPKEEEANENEDEE